MPAAGSLALQLPVITISGGQSLHPAILDSVAEPASLSTRNRANVAASNIFCRKTRLVEIPQDYSDGDGGGGARYTALRIV